MVRLQSNNSIRKCRISNLVIAECYSIQIIFGGVRGVPHSSLDWPLIKPSLQETLHWILTIILIISTWRVSCLPLPAIFDQELNLTGSHFLPGLSYVGSAESVLWTVHERPRAPSLTYSGPTRNQMRGFTYDLHPEEKLSRSRPR